MFARDIYPTSSLAFRAAVATRMAEQAAVNAARDDTRRRLSDKAWAIHNPELWRNNRRAHLYRLLCDELLRQLNREQYKVYQSELSIVSLIYIKPGLPPWVIESVKAKRLFSLDNTQTEADNEGLD